MSGYREMFSQGESIAMNGIDPNELYDEYALLVEAIDTTGYIPNELDNEFMVQAEGYLLEFGYL